jgi:hypothetical protein
LPIQISLANTAPVASIFMASFITGMVMKPDELKSPCAHADNLLAY